MTILQFRRKTDKVKKNLKKKDQDFGFVNYEDPSDPDRN
jgi:hypothetical protein